MAHGKAIWRGSLVVDPPPGNKPRRGSPMPKLAFSAAMRISVPCSISMPPAMQKPFTAAMIGL